MGIGYRFIPIKNQHGIKQKKIDNVIVDNNGSHVRVQPDDNYPAEGMYGDSFLSNLYMRDMKKNELLDAAQEVSLAKQIEPMAAVYKKIRSIGKALKKLDEKCEHADSEKKEIFEKLLDERANLEKTLAQEISRLTPESEEARNTLVTHNLRLVIAIAKTLRNRGLPLTDLIQEGSIGLMRAAEKYNWKFGYRFSTYALWWIRQSIVRSITDHRSTVRLPSYLHEAFPKVMSLQERYIAEHGYKPSLEYLTRISGYKISVVERVLTSGNIMLRLENYPENEKKLSFQDKLSYTCYVPFEYAIFDKEREEKIASILDNQLDNRQRDIIQRRNGLGEYESQTLAEIGGAHDLSRERIRQIESEALDKLKKPQVSRMLRELV